MKRLSLRSKILLSVGCIIFLVLGTTTLIYIQDLKRDYLEALQWNAETLSQSLTNIVSNMQSMGVQTIDVMYSQLSLYCIKLYEVNKEKSVTHLAVIGADGVIGSHNNADLWGTSEENPKLLAQLRRQTLVTFLDNDVYHTLVPIFNLDHEYIASIDIGLSRDIVDDKTRKTIRQAVALLVVFLVLTIGPMFFLLHVLLTKPVRNLAQVGQDMAQGSLVYATQSVAGGDEIATVSVVFHRIANYLQNIAGVAENIATGVLDGDVQIRSEQDVLGKATDEMLRYLRYIANVATKMADGDLREHIQVRSTSDEFGRAIHAMAQGLRALIAQIRESAEHIAATGESISELSADDITIVQEMHASAEVMTSTMQELGSSIQEVAHNMDVLSTSVELTSASVSQMTSSIAYISGNSNELIEQTHRTIEYLDGTITSLNDIVKSTDESKDLSRNTIAEALRGQEAVEEVTTSMETIEHTITTAVDSMARFEQRSRDIDRILDVIQQITGQTTLLALNASIIAAQAGAHGRGFAVVAEEIKNLASGVGTSTKDIAAIVKTLQQETSQVVQTIHAGADDVRQGMARTRQARETLQKIIASAERSSGVVTTIADTLHGLMDDGRRVSEAMERVNAMITDITTATNEQEASTRQIDQAVTNINAMASQIQRATTEQSDGVRQALHVMDRVTDLVDKNLDSSQRITDTTQVLSAQASLLLHSVDRFTLSRAPAEHES